MDASIRLCWLAIGMIAAVPWATTAAWEENWDRAAPGSFAPPATLQGSLGTWVAGDTASECGPSSNRVEIVPAQGGGQLLKLVTVPSDGSCAENMWVGFPGPSGVPIATNTLISFKVTGNLVNPKWGVGRPFPTVDPPPGDNIHLTLQDSRGNLLVYIFQRSSEYIAHRTSLDVWLPSGQPGKVGYCEIFMDDPFAEGGTYARNLYLDLLNVPWFSPQGTSIGSMEFEITSPGWATLDDLRIGADLNVTPPSILIHPANVFNNEGRHATFTVTVDPAATRPIDYLWLKNGYPVFASSSTRQTLELTNVYYWDAGLYQVVVRNAGGSVTSNPALLTILPRLQPPLVQVQPKSQTALVTQPATISVIATGSPPLFYQWMRNNAEMPGQTNPVLEFRSIRDSDAASYRVVITNEAGRIESELAFLTVRTGVFLHGRLASTPELSIRQIGDGTNHVSLTWSFASSIGQLNWFFGSSRTQDSDVAHAEGVSSIDQLTDASRYTFVPDTIGQYGTGNLMVWRNNLTGHYGVLNPEPWYYDCPYLKYGYWWCLSGDWWFRCDGQGDFSPLKPAAPVPQMLNPRIVDTHFTVTVLSVAGFHYELQSKDSFSDTAWKPVTSTNGNSAAVLLQDLSPLSATRFYQVQIK